MPTPLHPSGINSTVAVGLVMTIALIKIAAAGLVNGLLRIGEMLRLVRNVVEYRERSQNVLILLAALPLPPLP